MKVYIDYILVKSLESTYHLNNLRETFFTLWRFNMKPNPEKYTFGGSFGKFLGVVVSNRGIKVNLA